MPKKSAATRGGAQRNKPKSQKSFELVQSNSTERVLEEEENDSAEQVATSVATTPADRKEGAVAPKTAASEVKEKENALPATGRRLHG